MLEHVSEEVGAQYLDAILSFSSITEKEIIEFCAKNDVLGDPAKYVYGNMCVSPTSLRYIFQAHLILTHMKAISQLACWLIKPPKLSPGPTLPMC